jgi:regulator of sirC expression with transglutaminase-like and TPR domain
MIRHPPPSTFDELAGQGESLDVALGVALLARDVYGDLAPQDLLARFDELAKPLVGQRLGQRPLHQQADALGAHLYVHLGFSGNEDDYYDPKNSLLPDVLERRRGIPISLALVYCEVARRVGVRARGVGFPGHFLVRLDCGPERDGQEDPIFIDPFFGGRVLDEAALAALLGRVAGQAHAAPVMRPDMLAPIAPRPMLLRWLHNLRSVYLARNELSRALLVVDRIAALSPGEAGPLRDRGLLAAKLGATTAAREDLERVVLLDPSGEHGREAKAALARLGEPKGPPN